MRTILAVAFPALLLSGCPNPEGDYNDFVDRYNSLHPGTGGAGGEGATGGTDGGACVVPTPDEVKGEYLFVLSAVLKPLNPLVFDLKVDASAVPFDGGTTTGMTWTLQPLKYSDRKTAVGNPIVVKDLVIAPDGSIHGNLGDVAVAGAANPISKDVDIVAKIDSIDGTFCGTDGFYCGSVQGNVTKPIPLKLAGSTWTMTKVTGTAPAPEPPPINCKKTLANAVGDI